MSTSKKTANKEKADGKVYVGPTINRISAIRNRTYIGTLPAVFQAAIKEYKWLANLLVSPSEVSAASASIKRQDGAYWEAYKLAEGLLNKTGGK